MLTQQTQHMHMHLTHAHARCHRPPLASSFAPDEYRTYWFEILESLRKVLLVGVPAAFPGRGGNAQLVWGLLVCCTSWLGPHPPSLSGIVPSLCTLLALCASPRLAVSYLEDAPALDCTRSQSPRLERI